MNIPGFGLRLVLLQRTKMLPGKQLHRPQRMDRERRDAKPLFPGKIGDPHHGGCARMTKLVAFPLIQQPARLAEQAK
jgi:hypothetical protein